MDTEIPETPLFFNMFVFFIFLLFVQHAADKENLLLNAILARVFKTSKEEESKETNDQKEKKEEEQEQVKQQKKYEDKYAEEFNLVPDELEFTEVELQKEVEQKVIIRKQLEDALECKKNQLQTRISILQEQITNIDNEPNIPPEELLKSIQEEQTNLQVVQEQQITDEELDKAAREYSIKERLDNLKNCIVMEKTPVGNVVMFYNNSRESFEYYSDSTIPYRYLEVIGKKYVLTYRCKQIYVNMEAEIKEAERKLEEKKQKQKQKQQEQEVQNQGTTVDKPSKTKDVFAKFKNYNKDTSVKVAAVPLDRLTTAKQTKPQEEKIVKERANRYSFEGKLANFNFLKKIDRKVVDKRYAISFSEFKKMQQQTNQ